jgi:hypothetical protein
MAQWRKGAKAHKERSDTFPRSGNGTKVKQAISIFLNVAQLRLYTFVPLRLCALYLNSKQ